MASGRPPLRRESLGSAVGGTVKLSDLTNRVDELLKLAVRTLATTGHSEYGGTWVDTTLFSEFRSAALSFLKATYGTKHPHFQDFDTDVKGGGHGAVVAGMGILNAVQTEFKGGWLASTTGIVSAEVFADFMEMARHLLDEHYKDAAAVMIGGVLEEHLRQLCRREGIDTEIVKDDSPVPRKADALNADLANANVYSKLDLKSVTAWLDLRNKAAHGRYAEYSEEQVGLMYSAVADFLARNQL